MNVFDSFFEGLYQLLFINDVFLELDEDQDHCLNGPLDYFLHLLPVVLRVVFETQEVLEESQNLTSNRLHLRSFVDQVFDKKSEEDQILVHSVDSL